MSMFNPEGGFDMNALLQQAQAMQAQFQQAQANLESQQVSGSAGGDLVKVEMSGSGELLNVTIAPEVIDPEDPETLGDLVVAAVRDAQHKVEALAQSTMPQLPNLPF